MGFMVEGGGDNTHFDSKNKKPFSAGPNGF
jgi:hypothetical protein